MLVQKINNSVPFQYKSVLKEEFRAGRIPLKKDITGALLKRGEETVDHTIPKSKGGRSHLFNYSLMSEQANKARGNKPLKPYIDLESFIEYVKVMLDVKTDDVDGVEYLKGWLPNILRAIREEK